MKALLTAVIFAVSILGSAWGQTAKPTTLADLAKYTGPDRERILYDGARREGKVVWYTSLVPYKEIGKFFESKYPGVTVETYRANAVEIAGRVLTETRSKRYVVDAIETTPGALMIFRDNQLLMPYTSRHLAEYPDGSKEGVSGGLVLWTTDRESYIGVGYNKNGVSTADVPKNFDDLLKPALKGKMGVGDAETEARIVGAMLKAKGESFVRRLKEQDVRLYGVTGPGLNELIVTGEVPLSFAAFSTNIGHSVAKGAPVAWVAMDLAVANAGGAAISARAQRPHAALLLTDFLLSPEGQKMLTEKFRYGSPVKDYGFVRWYPEKGLTTSEYTERQDRWLKLLLEITRR
ncbi:MAG: extracellular solute-binding protein [Deltaproteobacteria bacterium]|nr:extracellular solute-binding protein [Deltaproteobacteria bacterium]